MIGAGLFDMVDGRVARETNQVTRFGGFFDSVLDRYSDLAVLMGLLVYYASINRFFYVVLTAIVMTGTVLVSYTRARAENTIPRCKIGFLERPERVVLVIIGALIQSYGPGALGHCHPLQHNRHPAHDLYVEGNQTARRRSASVRSGEPRSGKRYSPAPVVVTVSRPCFTPLVLISPSAIFRTCPALPFTTSTSRQLSWSRCTCIVERMFL